MPIKRHSNKNCEADQSAGVVASVYSCESPPLFFMDSPGPGPSPSPGLVLPENSSPATVAAGLSATCIGTCDALVALSIATADSDLDDTVKSSFCMLDDSPFLVLCKSISLPIVTSSSPSEQTEAITQEPIRRPFSPLSPQLNARLEGKDFVGSLRTLLRSPIRSPFRSPLNSPCVGIGSENDADRLNYAFIGGTYH